MQQQKPEPSFAERLEQAGGWLYLVARSVAVTAEVSFLRTRFGSRYPGLPGFLALPVVLLYTLAWSGSDLRPLAAYVALYLVMSLVARIGGMLYHRRMPCAHSRYDGFPRIARLFPRLGERAVKRVVEPVAVLALAAAVLPLNKPLGGYLLLTAVALFLTVNLNEVRERMQAINTHDLFIEQQQMASRFRGMRGTA